MTEFTDAGNKSKTQFVFKSLYNRIERLHTSQNIRNFCLYDVIENRLIIFIKKDHNILLLCEFTDDFSEHIVRGRFRQLHIVIRCSFLH